MTDELTRVREVRADVPDANTARLAEGRERLLDEARGVRGRKPALPRLRMDWRITALAATAVVGALVVLGSQLRGTGTDDHTVVGVDAMVEEEDAAALLRHAASVVEEQPDPRPRAGQWAYQKTLQDSVGGSPEKFGPWERERWLGYDEKPNADGVEGYSPRERFELIRDLPSDPKKLLSKARESFGIGQGGLREEILNYRAMTELLASYPMPPKGLANVYRAMAEGNVAQVKGKLVKDAIGRPAVALYPTEDMKDPGQQIQLLLDPVTFAYLGHRVQRLVDGPPQGENTQKAGDIFLTEAVTDTGLVRHKGQRP